MPQSNPQADIHNILSDASSPVPQAPKKKINTKHVWLIALAVLIVAGIVIYSIVHTSPRNTGLSEEEKMQILDYLEKETTPVAVPYTEKASIIEKLQDRAKTAQ